MQSKLQGLRSAITAKREFSDFVKQTELRFIYHRVHVTESPVFHQIIAVSTKTEIIKCQLAILRKLRIFNRKNHIQKSALR